MTKYILVIGAIPEAFRQIKRHLEDSNTVVLYSATTYDALYQLSLREFILVMIELEYISQGIHALYPALHKLEPVPILALFANADVTEECGSIGLESDDVISGPFDMEGCIATAKARMEQYTRLTGNDNWAYIIACGQDLVINPITRTVSLHGNDLELSQKQFDILYLMASHPGQVLSKSQLFDYLCGEPNVEVNNSIAQYISKLRKKLGENPDDPSHIQTVRGIGYKFAMD